MDLVGDEQWSTVSVQLSRHVSMSVVQPVCSVHVTQVSPEAQAAIVKDL